jgi:hypothetical protein
MSSHSVQGTMLSRSPPPVSPLSLIAVVLSFVKLAASQPCLDMATLVDGSATAPSSTTCYTLTRPITLNASTTVQLTGPFTWDTEWTVGVLTLGKLHRQAGSSSMFNNRLVPPNGPKPVCFDATQVELALKSTTCGCSGLWWGFSRLPALLFNPYLPCD